ncbi:hypothetical protein ACM0P6_07040 [Komagataeibacter sucrofermentans]|uniref:hypothetical protein n=1 Tax=Komagataeibacter sucrofermentans TaxID=1053551 RepID=UPI0011B7503E|nr:hypothetical protein [Komagataeibacter sucrofermentans]GBQ51082.1 hypothetical protein AA15973_2290 [Komagataeibacter sucrofermentans DSM 15973]
MATEKRKYRIVGARPLGATNHINSEFHMYRWGKLPSEQEFRWHDHQWKSIKEVESIINEGHEVMTGKYFNNKHIEDGSRVEFVLRVTTNGGKHKIGSLPDK